MSPRIPTEDEVLEYFNTLSNWGRWGPDDELGTLNLITNRKRVQAASLVKHGITVGCARPIVPGYAPDVRYPPPVHFMLESGEAYVLTSAPQWTRQFTTDYIGMGFHGRTITHIDSLCHEFWQGKMYNGRPADKVTTTQGATANAIENVKDGIVTRGVLLDITKVRGKEWLEAGEGVFPEDLEAAERAQGVRVEEGDALCLRLGWFERRDQLGAVPPEAGQPGLHAAALPWLHQRGVAVIADDGTNGMRPSGYQRLEVPVHQVGIVAMGLWLIDAANFDELAVQCRALNRWDFMFTVAPLYFPSVTGSPVTPLATF